MFIKRESTIQAVRFFNSLPLNIKKFSDDPRTFKSALKNSHTRTPIIHYMNIITVLISRYWVS